MTVTLILPPEIEKAYLAEALAKGVPVDVVLRDTLVSRQLDQPKSEFTFDAANSTGAALITAMQASPYKDVTLEPTRLPLPVRDVTF